MNKISIIGALFSLIGVSSAQDIPQSELPRNHDTPWNEVFEPGSVLVCNTPNLAEIRFYGDVVEIDGQPFTTARWSSRDSKLIRFKWIEYTPDGVGVIAYLFRLNIKDGIALSVDSAYQDLITVERREKIDIKYSDIWYPCSLVKGRMIQ